MIKVRFFFGFLWGGGGETNRSTTFFVIDETLTALVREETSRGMVALAHHGSRDLEQVCNSCAVFSQDGRAAFGLIGWHML